MSAAHLAAHQSPPLVKDVGMSGGNLLLPRAVFDSADYMALSPDAKALLLKLMLQMRHRPNGFLRAKLRGPWRRGWRYVGVLYRARRELIDARMLRVTDHGYCVLDIRPLPRNVVEPSHGAGEA